MHPIFPHLYLARKAKNAGLGGPRRLNATQRVSFGSARSRPRRDSGVGVGGELSGRASAKTRAGAGRGGDTRAGLVSRDAARRRKGARLRSGALTLRRARFGGLGGV